MYAYCNNNPINCYDNLGMLPQAVQDKQIHDLVLQHICAMQPNLSWKKTCVYYNGKDARGGWGFCDLYNKSTGEVWELKKNSTSRSCTTAAALAQLTNYTGGKLKHNPKLKLKLPSTTEIESGSFTYTQFGYNYSIQYWSEGNGILRYQYTRTKTNGRKVAEAVAMTAVSVALMFFVPSAGLVFA